MDTGRTANWAVGGRPVSRRRGVYISGSCQTRERRRTEMGKIVISTNVSLDGVVQDPDGKEGFRVVLGAGERLFGEASDKKGMRLLSTRTIGDCLTFLTYEFVRGA